MSVKLQLKGFDRYLKELREAGANVQKVTENTLLESAQMFNAELIKQTDASPMSEATKERMKKSLITPAITYTSDRLVIAEAGYRIGEDYHSSKSDELSGGFIALFNEYGTVKRRTKRGVNRGSLEQMEFTRRTHRKIDGKIRKRQEEILQDALKELKG